MAKRQYFQPPPDDTGDTLPPLTPPPERPAPGLSFSGVTERSPDAAADLPALNAPPPVAPDPADPSLALSPSSVGVAARPQRSPLERMQDEYQQLAADQHPADRNGRWRSALSNMFYEASRQAQAVTDASLRTGRPVDAYGLAGVAGAGAGGFAGGAISPNVDEATKRGIRMRALAEDIGTQLSMERAQSEMANAGRRLDIEEEANRQASEDRRFGVRERSIPKPIVLGGKLIQFRRGETPTGEPGDLEAYVAEADGKPIVDETKVVGPDGLTSWQHEQIQRWRDDRSSREKVAGGHDQTRVTTTTMGIKSREGEGAANRASREKVAAGHDSTQQSIAAGNNAARASEGDKNRASREGIAAKGRRASVQRLAVYAQQKGVPLADAIKEAEGLGVEVYDEDEKK